MSVTFTSDTVALRALEPTDLDILYKWENDATVWTVTDTVAPFSRQVLWQYLQAYTADIYQSRQLRLIAERLPGNEPIGTVDFFNFSPLNNRAELGLYIAPEFRGKGLGRQVLDLLVAYARDHIGLRQLYVYITTDNAACLQLFDSYGFMRAGHLKDWVKRGNRYTDVELLQLML